MKNLTNEELMNVDGGGIKLGIGIGFGIVAIGAFLIGVIDGLVRPLKCN